VNTAFWIGGGVWKDFSATGGLPNEVVTVTAKPTSLAWDFGDGSPTLTCYSAGSSTDTKTCVHTYQRSSASRPGNSYAINVVMTWDVSWTCAGANCQGQGQTPVAMQPPLTMPGNAPLAVGEIQSNASSQP